MSVCESPSLTKDILCYMLKFFKINSVPLKHIHGLRNIYNSSKNIRQFMSKEQIVVIEGWKKIIYMQMKFTSKRRYTGTSYLRCTVCFCKYPYMDSSPHKKYGCPLSAEFCKEHIGGTKLYPRCMFDVEKTIISNYSYLLTQQCKLCNLKKTEKNDCLKII